MVAKYLSTGILTLQCQCLVGCVWLIHPPHFGIQFKPTLHNFCKFIAPSAVAVVVVLLFHGVLEGSTKCSQLLARPKNEGRYLGVKRQKWSLRSQPSIVNQGHVPPLKRFCCIVPLHPFKLLGAVTFVTSFAVTDH